MSEYTDYGLDFNLFPKQLLLLAHPDMVPEGYEIPDEVLFGGAAGGGKATPLTSVVMTPFGIKTMGDMKIGSLVSNPDGTIAKVLQIHPQGVQDIYKVSFSDGSSARCTKDHLWLVHFTRRKVKADRQYIGIAPEDNTDVRGRIVTTAELIEFFKLENKSNSYPVIPLTQPVQFTRTSRAGLDSMRPIDPYVLGVLLGDGCLVGSTLSITSNDIEIVRNVEMGLGYSLSSWPSSEYGYGIPDADGSLRKSLIDLGLLGQGSLTKHIPKTYLYSSIEDRFSILQGLMDTDGTTYKEKRSAVSFCSSSHQLAKDVQFLVGSLGGRCTITEKEPFYRDENGEKVQGHTAYICYIQIPDASRLFRLSRKKERVGGEFNGGASPLSRRMVSIEPDGREEAQCITVDHPNGLYLTDDFIVTHNSYAMRVISIILAIECPGVNVYLFRKTYTELDSNHMLGPQGYRALLSTAVDNKMVRIDSQKNLIQFRNGPTGTFAGGSLIYLRHAQYDKDMYIYQGAEIHVMMIDEATHFSEPIYSFLRARVRTGSWRPPEKWAKWFPRILCSSNPGNTYHNFWKHIFVDFVDPEHPYQPVRAPEDDGGMLRQYIPATVYDNPALLEHDPNYISRLKGLGSPELVRAMLEGDWDIVAGGMFDDLWRRGTHIIEKPFKIPKGWYINRGFDWGSSKPFAALWYAESNGDPVTLANGKEFKFPPGTIVVLDEWYGHDPDAKDPNTGLRMSNVKMGEGIRNREETSFILAPIKDRICPGPADASIYTVMNNDSPAAGINSGYWGTADRAKTDIFFPSDKSKGTRVKRWSLIRNRLSNSHDIKGSNPMEQPALFVFPTCKHLIRTLPTAPRDERNHEDIDSESEDHLLDTLGYRVLQARSGIGRLRTKIG